MRRRTSAKSAALVNSEAEEFLTRHPQKKRPPPSERADRAEKRGRAMLGLRNIAEQVYQMLQNRYPHPIKLGEIVEELPDYRHCRRRVGDVLNVLIAVGMITSSKKEYTLSKDHPNQQRRQHQPIVVDNFFATPLDVDDDDPLEDLLVANAESATPPRQ